MSLKLLSLVKRNTSTLLTLYYSCIYIFSSLVLFGLTYYLLSQAVRDADRRIVLEKMNKYYSVDQTKGMDSLIELLRLENADGGLTDYFIDVQSPQHTSLLALNPAEWKDIPHELPLSEDSSQVQWVLRRSPKSGAVVEIAVRKLSDGSLLLIGSDAADREELLDSFKTIFAIIMITVVAFGILAGTVLANRMLRPIRDLIAAVRSIEIGVMDARVPSRQSDDELSVLAHLFNKMLDKINLLITGMREALDNVAHDLRTPVTRQRAVIETALQAEPHLENYREALMDCAEESERIITMLDILMDISEAETGTMKLELKRINLTDLIEDTVELYHYIAEEKSLAFSSALPEQAMVTADENRIRQILANLLDNAVKYTAPGGSVDIELTLKETEAVVIIRDTGVGIPAKDIPRIFDRLYRGDKSRTHRGLGLGLSLVKAVLRAHNGDIKVRSELGQGSEFEFHLPVWVKQDELPALQA